MLFCFFVFCFFIAKDAVHPTENSENSVNSLEIPILVFKNKNKKAMEISGIFPGRIDEITSGESTSYCQPEAVTRPRLSKIKLESSSSCSVAEHNVSRHTHTQEVHAKPSFGWDMLVEYQLVVHRVYCGLELVFEALDFLCVFHSLLAFVSRSGNMSFKAGLPKLPQPESAIGFPNPH